jgi:hypothetical protein
LSNLWVENIQNPDTDNSLTGGSDLTKKQSETIENFEKKILSHFQSENEALTKYYLAIDNIDNMK